LKIDATINQKLTLIVSKKTVGNHYYSRCLMPHCCRRRRHLKQYKRKPRRREEVRHEGGKSCNNISEAHLENPARCSRCRLPRRYRRYRRHRNQFEKRKDAAAKRIGRTKPPMTEEITPDD
jgi:hypothetical protein